MNNFYSFFLSELNNYNQTLLNIYAISHLWGPKDCNKKYRVSLSDHFFPFLQSVPIIRTPR